MSKNAPGKLGDAEAKHSAGAPRSESSESSASGPPGGQAAASAARPGGVGGQMVEIDLPGADDEQPDANSPDLFTLAQLQLPTRFAGGQSQGQVGSNFHGMASESLSSFGRAAPASPSSRRSIPEAEAAACCADPAASENPVQPLQGAALLNGPIPEPTTWVTLVLGVGLSGLMLRRRRRRWA